MVESFGPQEPGSVVVVCPRPTLSEWLEIELIDVDDCPVGFVQYSVVLATGDLVTGYLDADGFARLENVEIGTCVVTFPELDGTEWEFLETANSKLMPT